MVTYLAFPNSIVDTLIGYSRYRESGPVMRIHPVAEWMVVQAWCGMVAMVLLG